MKDLTNEQLMHVFMREVAQLTQMGMTVRLRLEPSQAMALIGAVQLACAHPGFIGPSRQVVEQMVREMEETFTKYDVPGLSEVIRRGWVREYDEKREGRST